MLGDLHDAVRVGRRTASTSSQFTKTDTQSTSIPQCFDVNVEPDASIRRSHEIADAAVIGSHRACEGSTARLGATRPDGLDDLRVRHLARNVAQGRDVGCGNPMSDPPWESLQPMATIG